MGDKIYVAKQDTLLEVQQTGTEVQQKVNKTDATIGDIGDPAGEESLVGLVKNIPESVPKGAIKSIQSIIINQDQKTGDDSSFGGAAYKDYTISPVVIGKSIVLASSARKSNSGVDSVCARFIDEKTIRVYASYSSMGSVLGGILVQVVEFF